MASETPRVSHLSHICHGSRPDVTPLAWVVNSCFYLCGLSRWCWKSRSSCQGELLAVFHLFESQHLWDVVSSFSSSHTGTIPSEYRNMEITAHGTVRVRGNTQNTREENPCWLSIRDSVSHSSEVDIDGHLCSPVRGLSSSAHTQRHIPSTCMETGHLDNPSWHSGVKCLTAERTMCSGWSLGGTVVLSLQKFSWGITSQQSSKRTALLFTVFCPYLRTHTAISQRMSHSTGEWNYKKWHNWNPTE